MRIRWTELAARDLTRICDYIKEHNGPAAARRVTLLIYDGVGAGATAKDRKRFCRCGN